MDVKDMQPIILCGGSQGRAIIFGRVPADPVPGEPVTLYGARMVIRWAAECGGLLGLAAEGPKGDTRMTPGKVARLGDQAWQQWMTVGAEAAKAFDQWKR